MTDPATARPAAQDGPVQAVFRRALRHMLLLVGVLAVVGVVVGALVSDPPSAGVWGALIGAAVTLLFSGTTVVSMLRTADSPPTTTMAVIMGAWLVKMVVLVVILAVLRDQYFYDRSVLVVVLLAGVLGSIYLDYRAVHAGRVPYVDPGQRV